MRKLFLLEDDLSLVSGLTFAFRKQGFALDTARTLAEAEVLCIYGSRAAYGVVLVTTKGGKAEKMNVAYSGYVGVKTPTIYRMSLIHGIMRSY